LLGKRDPDDVYASNEIPVFQSLANQTALALVNIYQAERLHMLHQSDIERSEAERMRLARILHDDVLNQLAVLRNGLEGDAPAKWEEAYQAAADHIREVITGLRPVMLVPYGLRAALVELIDLLNDTNISKTKVQADLASDNVRYPPAVELQLFRIAQQACENAIKHSQAGTITLKGEFEPKRVYISVEDNGVGFAAGERLDLPWLLANKHYGLAGMYERAALIGAQLSVKSYDQQGTTVQVTWISPPDLLEGK
jgi:signal transduction histidine kinase